MRELNLSEIESVSAGFAVTVYRAVAFISTVAAASEFGYGFGAGLSDGLNR